ncbi:hypothetical protein OS493_026006 [Desmophyllum pertusum]|uniref:Uncharacterized protein n=1 Tax=Desmophyllum pertusum TaxID=174260 RepID=A0A9W9YP79_9CNID|nr:hypothetical protein OS493_026006 [Desmophyllum pertusum]
MPRSPAEDISSKLTYQCLNATTRFYGKRWLLLELLEKTKQGESWLYSNTEMAKAVSDRQSEIPDDLSDGLVVFLIAEGFLNKDKLVLRVIFCIASICL